MATAADNPNAARIALRVAIAAYYHTHHGKLDHSWSKAVEFFAEYAVVRAPRTVTRWLDGGAPIPAVVQRAVNRIVEDFTGP